MGKWLWRSAVLLFLCQPAFAELKTGTNSPGFRLSALSGEMITWTIQKDRLALTVAPKPGTGEATQSNPKAALLHFCQPACRVCQEEMVPLQKLHGKYGKQGVTVLGVSGSPMEDTAKKVVKQLGLTYPMLKGAGSADVDKWETLGCPVYVVDAGGVIRFSQVGFTEGDEKKWEQTIQTLLSEKAK